MPRSKMLSKELMNAVMSDECLNVCFLADGKSVEDGAYLEGQYISYAIIFEGDFEYWAIDVNSLANQCKEWAMKQGFQLISWLEFGVDVWFCKYVYFNKCGELRKGTFSGDTEPDVIFKTAQHVLKLISED